MKIVTGPSNHLTKHLGSVTFGTAFRLSRRPNGWIESWDNLRDRTFILTSGYFSSSSRSKLEVVDLDNGCTHGLASDDEVFPLTDAEVHLP